VERLLGLGHQVLGIEQSSGMAAVLKNRQFGPSFSLLEESMEAASIPSGRADAVLAIGSLQYTRNPEEMVRRFAGWLKPGGLLCVLADSLVGLVTELLHAHKIDEAHERLRTRTAVWQQHGLEAKLHLFDRRTIEGFFAAAEFVHVSTAGMLITASAWGRDECTQAARTDLDGLLKIERRFLCDPAMADSGKHLLTIGRRP
jgi:SAM-dependent methyltransferase